MCLEMGGGRIEQNLRLLGLGVSCREKRDMWQVPRYLQACQELGTEQLSTEGTGVRSGTELTS